MGSKVNRTTISIPQELKPRMDAVAGQVNWSAVAAAAFEAKLLEIEFAGKRGSMSKEDIVKRLKAARQEEGREDFEEGKAAGRGWAAETATPKELERLDNYIDGSQNNDWWDVEDPGWSAPFGAPQYLVFALRPKQADDREAAESFWQEALGDAHERCWDSDFLRGFGEGALEVWREVKSQVR